MMAKICQLNKKIIVNKVHIPINITVGRRKKHCDNDKSALSSTVVSPPGPSSCCRKEHRSEKAAAVQPLRGAIAGGDPSSDVGSHGCTQCGRNFSSSTNLYRHARSIHKAETYYPKAKMKCCLCDYECLSRKVFDRHVTADHGVSLLTEEFGFATFEDFEAWKASVEKRTRSSFIKKSGIRKTKTFEQVNYYCHRSGSFRPSRAKAERKRKLKAQGSCKINSTCPSRMMVTASSSQGVRVVFHKTHVGHECDLGHLRLSYEQRKAVADKLADNVPFEDVLGTFRSSEPGRAQLLTRRDLLNIRREFGVGAEVTAAEATDGIDEATDGIDEATDGIDVATDGIDEVTTDINEANEASDENAWVNVSDGMQQDYPPIIFYVTQESPSREVQPDETEVRSDEPCEDVRSNDTVEEAKNKLRVKAESLIGGCATVEDCRVLQRLFAGGAVAIREEQREKAVRERQTCEKTNLEKGDALNEDSPVCFFKN